MSVVTTTEWVTAGALVVLAGVLLTAVFSILVLQRELETAHRVIARLAEKTEKPHVENEDPWNDDADEARQWRS